MNTEGFPIPNLKSYFHTEVLSAQKEALHKEIDNRFENTLLSFSYSSHSFYICLFQEFLVYSETNVMYVFKGRRTFLHHDIYGQQMSI